MITRWLVLSVALALCGCGYNQELQVSQPRHFAWDGLGRDPNLPVIKHARIRTEESKPIAENKEAELAKLRPFSREWVALLEEIDAEDSARVSKLMVICKGCEMASSQADRIHPSPSVNPNQRTTEVLR